jgi:hypothetical protein
MNPEQIKESGIRMQKQKLGDKVKEIELWPGVVVKIWETGAFESKEDGGDGESHHYVHILYQQQGKEPQYEFFEVKDTIHSFIYKPDNNESRN